MFTSKGQLLKFYNHDLQVKKNLSQLPSCAFSIALALFHQSSLKDEEEDTLASADKRLQDALIMFPSVSSIQ